MSLLDILARLGVSLVIGLLIGLEREISHKAAGIRTIALVTLGATLFTIISLKLTIIAQLTDTLNRYDFGRIIAYCIVGIGFLGSGTIKGDKKSDGLTTAAVLWVMVALGILAGLGEYTLAVISGSVIYLILASKYIKVKVTKRRKNV